VSLRLSQCHPVAPRSGAALSQECRASSHGYSMMLRTTDWESHSYQELSWDIVTYQTCFFTCVEAVIMNMQGTCLQTSSSSRCRLHSGALHHRLEAITSYTERTVPISRCSPFCGPPDRSLSHSSTIIQVTCLRTGSFSAHGAGDIFSHSPGLHTVGFPSPAGGHIIIY
jgi:hypothetical protein